MHHPSIVLVGLLLAGAVADDAQTGSVPAVPAPERISPATMLAPRSPRFSRSGSWLARPVDEQTPRFSFAPAAVLARDRTPASFQTLKTPYLRQVRLLVLQLWGGRLQLDSFGTTRRMDNSLRTSTGFRFGASASSGAASRGDRLYGFSLTFRSAENARDARSVEGCRCLGWLFSTPAK